MNSRTIRRYALCVETCRFFRQVVRVSTVKKWLKLSADRQTDSGKQREMCPPPVKKSTKLLIRKWVHKLGDEWKWITFCFFGSNTLILIKWRIFERRERRKHTKWDKKHGKTRTETKHLKKRKEERSRERERKEDSNQNSCMMNMSRGCVVLNTLYSIIRVSVGAGGNSFLIFIRPSWFC